MVGCVLAWDFYSWPLDWKGLRPPENLGAQDWAAVNATGFGVNRLGCHP